MRQSKQEVLVKQQALEAEINKKADADRYAVEQAAAAALAKRQRDAEAKKYEAEQEATARKYQAEQDAEGLQQMRTLAKNMSFLMKSIALGKEKFGLPEKEPKQFTNFVR